jgi:hypothetical protein
MRNKLIFASFLLVTAFILSCHQGPKIKKAEKTSDSTAVLPFDLIIDDQVSFISGIANSKRGCLLKLDSVIKWTRYASELDRLLSYDNSNRLNKMKAWADKELLNNKSNTTVFYPFSGPDFLNANILYPNADQYIMMGLEPIGYLPDICNMPPDSVNSYLDEIKKSMRDTFKHSYFITSRMKVEMKKTKVNGTIPLMSFFIKRTGHHIVSIQRIGVDSSGKWQIVDSLRNTKNIVPGVKIDFLSLSGGKVQSAFYFRIDISDKNLGENQGFKKYLSQLPQSRTFLKAASYLMHHDSFSIIRSIIFDISSTILQDDSGIAYKYFDQAKWDIKLYGKYSKPENEFSNISEPDLVKAYKHSTFRPLPFNLGYNWGTDHTSILYAVKR